MLHSKSERERSALSPALECKTLGGVRSSPPRSPHSFWQGTQAQELTPIPEHLPTPYTLYPPSQSKMTQSMSSMMAGPSSTLTCCALPIALVSAGAARTSMLPNRLLLFELELVVTGVERMAADGTAGARRAEPLCAWAAMRRD